MALVFLGLMVGVTSFAAAADPPSVWPALTSKDVSAYCADIRGIQPGMVDPLTPTFAKRVDEACTTAAKRARGAKSYIDWRETMEALVTSFRDGHTWISFPLTNVIYRWPGFLIDGQAGHWVVRRPPIDAVAPADQPPEGATLLGCDGQSTEAFLKEQLDNKKVDWSKLPERIRQAYKAFFSYRLEGPPPAKVCRFEKEGAISNVTLNWQSIPYYQFAPLVFPYFRRGLPRPIDAHFFADGHVWIRLGNVQNETALKMLEAELLANQARLRAASYVVFDLRGSAGGNSMWGERLASILWGQDAVEGRRLAAQPTDPKEYGKYWRRSKAAAAGMLKVAEEFAARGPDFADVTKFYRDLGHQVAAAAAAKGDGLFRDECCQPESKPDSIAKPEYSGKVFVLTDAGAFSSSVVVMNTFKRMGAIQVGEPSGQNEVYAEGVGPLDLPSGLGQYRIPFSIIRQPRSALGGLPPDVWWPGAMDDDKGLERWIDRLASGKPKPPSQAAESPNAAGATATPKALERRRMSNAERASA